MQRLLCLLLAALNLSVSLPAASLPAAARADRLVVTLAGDCTLGSEDKFFGMDTSFIQVVSRNGLDWPFSGVADWFANDDLTLVNLESTFTDYTKATPKTFNFRAPPEYADILTLGSVEAVTLANNHTLDYGERGFEDTTQALDERGIAYCSPSQPTVIEIKGRRIALLGEAYPMFKPKLNELCDRITAYREAGVDLIIVNLHWGYEYKYHHVQEQIGFAHQIIDAGADLLVGTHPHVLQGMEVYEGKPIFYSLGNFSFGGNVRPRDYTTAMVQLEYDIGDEEEAPRPVRLEVIPCRISQVAKGLSQDYRPIKATDEKDIRFIKKNLSWKSSGLPEDFFDTWLWLIDDPKPGRFEAD